MVTAEDLIAEMKLALERCAQQMIAEHADKDKVNYYRGALGFGEGTINWYMAKKAELEGKAGLNGAAPHVAEAADGD